MLHIIFIVFVSCNFVICMDQSETEVNKSLALSIALRHAIEIFDHSTLCSAAINKECEAALLQTAKLRKERLTKLTYYSNGYIWHKYGSAFSRKDFEGSTRLILNFYHLASTKYGWESRSANYFANYCGPIAGFEKTQFNAKGDCVFYGIEQKKGTMLWNRDYHINQYTISLNSQKTKKQCSIALKKDGSIVYALSELITFPALVKALLASKVVGENSYLKIYCLQDAIIPHNYKDWHQPSNFISEYNCFEDLPEQLKNVIESTYSKQNRKKSDHLLHF